jgi:hypothetical protein
MAAVVRPGAFCLFLLVACAKSDSDPGETKAGVTPAPMMPALDDAPTTVDRTWVPKKGHQSADTLPNPSLPDSLVDLLAKGYGDLDPGPGEPYLAQTLDDSKPPAPGPNPHRLLRFAHISDLQIADDESPTRLGNFDGPGLTSSALRPSDAYLCRMTNAAVRTINALHR